MLQNFNNTLRERWLNLFESQYKPEAIKVFHCLQKRYSHRRRHYHNLNHVELCLEYFDHVKDLLENPLAVELAIWFHDVIYRTNSKKNEEKSAREAIKYLKKLGQGDSILSEIENLILSTKSHRPQTQDEAFLSDIDLSILGALPEKFEIYEQSIRKEYFWVPLKKYHAARKHLYIGFLKQEKIYHTPYFQSRLEEQARLNLNESLKRLK